MAVATNFERSRCLATAEPAPSRGPARLVIAAAGAAGVVVPIVAVVVAQLELDDLARHRFDLDLVAADELDVPDLTAVLELENDLPDGG